MTTVAQFTAANPTVNLTTALTSAVSSTDAYAVENLVALVLAGINNYENQQGTGVTDPAGKKVTWSVTDKGIATYTLKGNCNSFTNGFPAIGV